ncbi:MAG TPA: hypothetical protein VE861_01090, partial [Gemmatimonadaceae bacterium]|nr:hypothetical protein [Gemmatimonadaceae bacterium]
MSFLPARAFLTVSAACTAVALSCTPDSAHAQRIQRPPAATQGFDPAECRGDCTMDSLTIDVDRGRRAQPGLVTATFQLFDTIAIPRRGAPPTPREQPVAAVFWCDSMPCGAAVVTGRINDRRIDDDRVTRRIAATWNLPAPLLLEMLGATTLGVSIDDRLHPLSSATVATTRTLLDSVRSALPESEYSPRARLYLTTFAAFGVPGDSTLAEDVGTATEPLMMPDAGTAAPTRVASLHFTGRGAEATPLLVQEDATGAAPIFGVGESVTVLLPARIGRRGVVTGKVLARQRVETMRGGCQGVKLWTYLLALPAADIATARRTPQPSPRPGAAIDRWNGVAVRERIAPRMLAAEQRQIAASRNVVAQFVRERAAAGLRESDVQVLATLPRGAGLVTNFGVITRDGTG